MTNQSDCGRSRAVCVVTRSECSRKMIKPSRIIILTSIKGVAKAREISWSVIAAKNANSRVLLCGCESRLNAASTCLGSPSWIAASSAHRLGSGALRGNGEAGHLSIDEKEVQARPSVQLTAPTSTSFCLSWNRKQKDGSRSIEKRFPMLPLRL